MAAVKGFTQVDRETAAQPVDVGQGLSDTLTMLRAKMKGKSATVTVIVSPGLPPVMAYGGELNQVWLNLIDNALDAVGPGGRVNVSADQEGREARRTDRRRRARHPGEHPSRASSIHSSPPSRSAREQAWGWISFAAWSIGTMVPSTSNLDPGHTVFTVSLPLQKAEPGAAQGGRSSS